MARDPWAVMDGANRRVDAEDARVAVGALLTTSTTNVTARQGLRPGPGNPGLVTQTGTPSINVTVNGFQAFVSATRGAGPYIVTEPAALTVPILDVPADPSNQRNDLIIYRQADTYYGDPATLSGVIVVRGNPSGTPTDPSLAAYPDHIPLARVRVTAGAPTVTTSMLDDLRPGSVVAIGGILPVADQAARDALTGTRHDGMTIYRIDRDWIEVYDTIAWRVQGIAVCSSTADRDSAITHPYSGQLAYVSSTGRIYQRHGGVWREMPGAVPVAQMRQTTTQSLADSTFTDITFTTEDSDALGGHSTVTNPARFTAPIAGIYEFSGGVAIAANATGLRVCQWALNGAALPASDNSQVSVGAGSATRMAARTYQVSMAVGDYVTLQGWQGSGGALSTVVAGAAASSMTVKFLGA